MSAEEIRGALIRAVPPLTVPPDRLAEVSRRVVRKRRLRLGLTLVAAAVASMVVVAAPTLLGFGGTGPGPGAPSGSPSSSARSARPSTRPSTRPSGRPSPSAPHPSPPPTRTPSGPCTGALDLMSGPLGGSDRSVALPLVRVTLCRYRHAKFDLSSGLATYVAGPVSAKPSDFDGPVRDYVDRPVPSDGCLYRTPYQNVVVDLVFTTDSLGTTREYLFMRISCSNNYVDPAASLEAAVDRVLGPPY